MVGDLRSFGLVCSASKPVTCPSGNDTPEGEIGGNRDAIGDVLDSFKPTGLLAGESLGLTPPPKVSYRSTISEIDPRRGDARCRGPSGTLKSEEESIEGFGESMNMDCGLGLLLLSTIGDPAGDDRFADRGLGSLDSVR